MYLHSWGNNNQLFHQVINMWKLHTQSIIMEKAKFKILKDCYGVFEVLNTLSLAFQEEYTCIYKHGHTVAEMHIYRGTDSNIHTHRYPERGRRACVYSYFNKSRLNLMYKDTFMKDSPFLCYYCWRKKSMVASNTYFDSFLWYGLFWFPDSPQAI